MSLPEWVSKEKIQDALRKYLNIKTLDVVGMMTKFAVSVGENYCSDLFRTTVKYTASKSGNVESISIIVKCRPEEGAKQMLTTEIPVFQKESEMFITTLPKLHQLLGEKCLAADCLLAEVKEHGMLIIQDLAPLGFKMADRRAGLDMDHSFLVIEKIAKMHASSVVLFEKDSHSMDQYQKGMYTNQCDSNIAAFFLTSGLQSLVAATSKWKGYEKYSIKLAALVNKALEKAVKAGERRSGFHVLNHGDLWINNILFHYNSDGKLDDLRFVDFQFSVFTSPAIDLQYFIYTSLREDIQRKHINRLLEFYHEQLEEKLINLNYPKEKIPSFDQIRDDFYERAFYGLAAAATVLPIVRAPSRKDANFEELLKSNDEEDGFRQISYNVPEYRSIMETLLPYYDKLGLLN